MSRVKEIERAIDSLTPEEFREVALHVSSIERLRAEIQVGLDAIDRGDYEEFDESTTVALAEDVKARGREELARLPRAGRAVDRISRGIRMFPVESYLIYYGIGVDDQVYIARVIHGMRDREKAWIAEPEGDN